MDRHHNCLYHRRSSVPGESKVKQQSDTLPAPRGWSKINQVWLPSTAYLLVIMVAGTHLLVFAKSVLGPILFGFYLSALLYPPMRALQRLYLPKMLAALVPLVVVFAALTVALLYAYEPFMKQVAKTPEIIDRLQSHIDPIKEALSEVDRKTTEVEKMVEKTMQQSGQKMQTVVVNQNQESWRDLLFEQFSGFIWFMSVTFMLCYFFLVGGDILTRNLAYTFTQRRHQHKVLVLARNIRDHVAQYLGVTLCVNLLYGLALGAMLWYFGVEFALAWGLVLGLLRYIPFVGNLVGLALVLVSVATVQFDPTTLLVAAGIVLGLMFVTGNFIDPMVHASRFELNPIFLFIAIIFWSWIWGFAGLFIAIPTLLVFAVFCGHVDSLGRFYSILCLNDQHNGRIPDSREPADS